MKLNELFDDEFQKNLNPDLSKGDIDGLDIDANFTSPVSNFFKKLRYFVPILDKCISRQDRNHFIIQKNQIHIILSVCSHGRSFN